MPKRTNAFQQLIAYIESAFAPHDAKVTESAMIVDSIHNVPREIDILIEGRVGDHSISIALECRDHERKADIKWIDELIGKYQNLPIDKIVAVSRSGFYKNATAKAKQNGIETLTLTEALEVDWLTGYEKIVDWTVMGRLIKFKRVGLGFDTTNDQPLPGFDLSSILFSEDEGRVGTVQELVDYIYKSPLIEESVQKEISKSEPQFKRDEVNIGQIEISVPTNLYLLAGDSTRHRIVNVIIQLECRLEYRRAKHKDYIYNKRLVSIAEVEMKDTPINMTAAIIHSVNQDDQRFKWFATHELRRVIKKKRKGRNKSNI